MPSRDRGRAKARSSDEEFVLFLQGIPAHCRWQELKDMVRQTALHIRQAVVYDDQHGFPTGLGQIIVKNEDEAWRTYHRLSTNGWDGQSLVVTLARTDSPTRPVAGPTKSPSYVIPPTYVAGYSTPPRVTQNLAMPPSPISPDSPLVATAPVYQGPEYGPVLSPMIPPPPPHYHHQPYLPIFTEQLPTLPHSPALRHSFCDSLAFAMLPTYPLPPLHHHEASFAPVRPNPSTTSSNSSTTSNSNSNNNTTRRRNNLPPKPSHNPPPGLAYPRFTPKRTIFVQNLNPTATSKDLTLFLQDAGTIEQCEMPLSPDTGRCKGFARVTFRTAEEAKRAVALYNAAFFLGGKIRIKIDRSANHVAAAAAAATAAGAVPGGPVRDPAAARDAGMQGPRPLNGNWNVMPVRPERKMMAVPVSVPVPVLAPTQAREMAARPRTVERCQPLVVNGSGRGSKTALAT
ncbi:RNA binding protein [Aspergillus clavatus NRRL 1]|uniref:RNA binding protein n=1 Tax=Aspergillus clavatus (strain ATCC 1007 / CBS 513.65 / DSM 816 / NCTC 3887 / NRRL 1 / QM 1276 / 107) TaxID=344612 RepID=A1CRY9_ASPCL|nr:RNA binding protein [Aspergillus clavatus NRRL 1]EAW08410.1 RNA binding protein [Aspergillus clavatus NRRL 1]